MIPSLTGLTIGIPFTGRMLPPDWGWTFGQLRWPMNVNLRFERTDGLPVDQARCELAERAVRFGTRWLFFLDEDVVPPLNAVKRLIQAMDERTDCAAIGGIYCDKTDPPQPMVFDEPGNGPSWDWTYGEVHRCGMGVATGCMLINVPLLARVPKPWFRTVDEPFERWTEDMWFCRQVHEAGLAMYAHGGVLARHFDLSTGKCYFLSSDSKPFRNVKEFKP